MHVFVKLYARLPYYFDTICVLQLFAFFKLYVSRHIGPESCSMFSMPYSQNVYFLIYRLGCWDGGVTVVTVDLRAIWFGCEVAAAMVLRF